MKFKITFANDVIKEADDYKNIGDYGLLCRRCKEEKATTVYLLDGNDRMSLRIGLKHKFVSGSEYDAIGVCNECYSYITKYKPLDGGRYDFIQRIKEQTMSYTVVFANNVTKEIDIPLTDADERCYQCKDAEATMIYTERFALKGIGLCSECYDKYNTPCPICSGCETTKGRIRIQEYTFCNDCYHQYIDVQKEKESKMYFKGFLLILCAFVIVMLLFAIVLST